MRLVLPLAIAVLFAGLLGGCGGSSTTGSGGGTGEGGAPAGVASRPCGTDALRVTGVGCDEAEAVLAAWRAAPGCRLQSGASHASCKVRGYVCIAARQGERAAVSCARPGRSILFAPE